MPTRIPTPKDPTAARAAEVIELLYDYVGVLTRHFCTVADSHGFTPVQAKVLLMLPNFRSTRLISSTIGCDPSNLTGVVQRLGSRGLITRQPDPADRRIKLVVLTTEGERVRQLLEMSLFAAVPGLSSLRKPDADALHTTLELLLQAAGGRPADATCPIHQPRTSTRR